MQNEAIEVGTFAHLCFICHVNLYVAKLGLENHKVEKVVAS